MPVDKLVETIRAILDRGNTAEVKRTKDGVIVLEVKRTIAGREKSEQGRPPIQ